MPTHKKWTHPSSRTFVREDSLIEDGCIFKLFGQDLSEIGAEVIDASGQLIVPRFFDIHTHGGCHVDFNHASVGDLQTVSTFFASQGTTYAHMSLVTDEISQIEVCIDALKPIKHQKKIRLFAVFIWKGRFYPMIIVVLCQTIY